MFAIALQQRQYQTYVLSNQPAQSRLEVVPERGGIITSWRVQDQDILYLDEARFANPDLSVRGGIPILFPICGNLPNNTYTYQGQQYTLKQHGFARDLPWAVTDQVTRDLVSLTLVLNSNEQTRAVYPFDFQLTFTYQLQGNSLEIRQRYTNLSQEPMPFCSGLHPYFWTSDKTQLQFDIPATQFRDHLTQATQPFSGKFDLSQNEIDVAFRPVTAQSATVVDPVRQLQLTLDYSDAYSTLVFWTVQGKEFYCLEPWTAPRHALNTGESLIQLAPEASYETWVRLTAKLL